LSNRELKRDKKTFSTLEADSPVNLYWLHRPEGEPATDTPSVSEGGKTIISDKFWDDFVIVAKAVKLRDPEANIYDAFNFIREHMMGGWTYEEDGAFIKDIDAQVEREYKKEQKRASNV
jgi:hypothetical protein